MKIVNVLIKDGVRIVNWDFPDSKSIGYVLDRFAFKPVMGTIRAGGVDIYDLEGTLIMDCPQENAPNGIEKRLIITLESVKPPAKPKPKKAENYSVFKTEDVADVR